jgi:hypothetical protein
MRVVVFTADSNMPHNAKRLLSRRLLPRLLLPAASLRMVKGEISTP